MLVIYKRVPKPDADKPGRKANEGPGKERP